MNCGICSHSYNPEGQSPVCPHLVLDPALAQLGGPRLRPELQREIEEAFNQRDKYTLTAWLGSLNFAARYYAQIMITRLTEIEKQETEQHGKHSL